MQVSQTDSIKLYVIDGLPVFLGRQRGMGKRGRGGRAAGAQHGPFLAPSLAAGGDESQHRDAITEANAT
jgi:hypothetical protein